MRVEGDQPAAFSVRWAHKLWWILILHQIAHTGSTSSVELLKQSVMYQRVYKQQKIIYSSSRGWKSGPWVWLKGSLMDSRPLLTAKGSPSYLPRNISSTTQEPSEASYWMICLFAYYIGYYKGTNNNLISHWKSPVPLPTQYPGPVSRLHSLAISSPDQVCSKNYLYGQNRIYL